MATYMFLMVFQLIARLWMDFLANSFSNDLIDRKANSSIKQLTTEIIEITDFLAN